MPLPLLAGNSPGKLTPFRWKGRFSKIGSIGVNGKVGGRAALRQAFIVDHKLPKALVVIEDLAGLETGKVLDVDDLCVIGAGAAGVTIAKQLLGRGLGTTRMSMHPADGVVNEECRAHGVDNPYLAGCSVFPTGGHANPTLTIVALAIRLSDHLRAQLGKMRGPPRPQAVGA